MNEKSVQEVSKQEVRLSKSDSRYWLPKVFRNTYTKDGSPQETSEWCIKLAYAGRRETVNLRTANQQTAAGKASALYKMLMAEGWDKTLALYKPKAVVKRVVATVGDLIREVSATTNFRRSTFTAYTQALRTIAAEVTGTEDPAKRGADGEPLRDRKKKVLRYSRHDSMAGGRDAWIAEVDSVPLGSLSAESIQKWRIGRVAKAGHAPDARRRAESTVTTLLRNARALFSEKALRFAKASLSLPEPLPFAGVKLEKRQSPRYQSRIDAAQLIADAKKELAVSERREEFKLFCLALLCGLRRAEADTLLWTQVDFTKGVIRIEPTEHFTPKSEESIGEVDLDPELLALLRGWRATAKGAFVVQSDRPARYASVSHRWYRCEPHFAALFEWLRGKGVSATKPLHELRKEVGSILASQQGIFAAQRVLRHAQIATTAAYYADKKGRITAGLGNLLAEEAATIPFTLEKDAVVPESINPREMAS